MKADNVLATIGNTPHIRVNRLFGSVREVWIKSERSNPDGSIEDRIALTMVEAAKAAGQLKPGGTIAQPTSGNTGIGVAIVAAVKGHKLILVMPDSVSVERRRPMLAYAATFELTPREKGMKGSIARAQEIVATTPCAWMPQKFENPANIDVNVRTTAEEAREMVRRSAREEGLLVGISSGARPTAADAAVSYRPCDSALLTSLDVMSTIWIMRS